MTVVCGSGCWSLRLLCDLESWTKCDAETQLIRFAEMNLIYCVCLMTAALGVITLNLMLLTNLIPNGKGKQVTLQHWLQIPTMELKSIYGILKETIRVRKTSKSGIDDADQRVVLRVETARCQTSWTKLNEGPISNLLIWNYAFVLKLVISCLLILWISIVR